MPVPLKFSFDSIFSLYNDGVVHLQAKTRVAPRAKKSGYDDNPSTYIGITERKYLLIFSSTRASMYVLSALTTDADPANLNGCAIFVLKIHYAIDVDYEFQTTMFG